MMSTPLTEDVPSELWDWNDFSSEMKKALSNYYRVEYPSHTLIHRHGDHDSLAIDGITNVPTTSSTLPIL
jgi:hypothetical protein